MAQHQVSAAALIPAAAQRVYAVIADYANWHPRILPRPHFVSLTVEKGGVGAGTVIKFQMRLMGSLRTFHSVISEPKPDRVLVETDLNTGAATTFSVAARERATRFRDHYHSDASARRMAEPPGGMVHHSTAPPDLRAGIETIG